MDNVFFVLGMVAMGGVVVSLFVGMFAMTRGKEKDHKTSNKMMQSRIIFQALAIIFLFLAYLTKN